MNKPQSHHIIGKVYDITAAAINKLATELDAKNEYIEKLEDDLASNVCGYCWRKMEANGERKEKSKEL